MATNNLHGSFVSIERQPKMKATRPIRSSCLYICIVLSCKKTILVFSENLDPDALSCSQCLGGQ